MKVLIMLLTLLSVPYYAEQAAAADDDKVRLQVSSEEPVEGDDQQKRETKQLMREIVINLAKGLGMMAALLVLLSIVPLKRNIVINLAKRLGIIAALLVLLFIVAFIVEGDDPQTATTWLMKDIVINFARGLGIMAALLVLFLIVPLVFTAVLRWSWKMTMPHLFNLKVVPFWQFFRLLLMVFMLSMILNGGGSILRSVRYYAEQVAGTSDDKVVLNSGKDRVEDDPQTARQQLLTNIVLKVAKGLALIILSLIPTVVFRWLWNMTMPGVFNLKVITFWQSFSLLLMVFMFGMILNWGGGSIRKGLIPL